MCQPHVVPSLFTETTLALLSDAVNAISLEDDRSLQMQFQFENHDEFISSQDNAQTIVVHLKCDRSTSSFNLFSI